MYINRTKMQFVCNKCNKNFGSNRALSYHTSHKACKRRDFFCKFCANSFTTSSNMYRHMQRDCHIKKEKDDEKAEVFEKLVEIEEKLRKEFKEKHDELCKKIVETEKENKKLRKVVKTIKNKSTNTTNNNNSNNNNNNNFGRIWKRRYIKDR